MIAIAGLWGGLAASSLVLGAWLALRLRPPRRLVGLVMGFGAGALIAAIAYELVPKHEARTTGSFLSFALGAVVFFAVDRALSRRSADARDGGDPGRSIVLGALLDGIPESLVLGMGLAGGGSISVAFLAAVFVSNLPEALGATSGMRDSGQPPRSIYRTWIVIVVVSAASAALGYGLLQLVPAADGSRVQAFAAGAVLTMLADSMMPEAYDEGGKLTGLLTALGFAVAGGLSSLE